MYTRRRESIWHSQSQIVGFLLICRRTDALLPLIGIKAASQHFHLGESVEYFPAILYGGIQDSRQLISIAILSHIIDVMDEVGIIYPTPNRIRISVSRISNVVDQLALLQLYHHLMTLVASLHAAPPLYALGAVRLGRSRLLNVSCKFLNDSTASSLYTFTSLGLVMVNQSISALLMM